MSLAAAPGLRERKRAETRAQLEQAAVTIAFRDGLEHTSVDAISAAANVSPRTFFNYFDSKEDAILGVHDGAVTADVVERHAAEHRDDGPVESTIDLLFAVLAPTLDNSSIHASRMELVRRYPQLLARHVAQITRMSDQLTAAIEVLLTKASSNRSIAASDASTTAEVLLATCGAAFRIAVKEWMTAGGQAPRKDCEARAVELVHNLRKALQ
jgi:AcrR family transcriptional regulator